jgi:alpha-glucosidase (family GH31 glycosyl hydrolase)
MTWYNSWSDADGKALDSTYSLPFSPGPVNMDHMSLSLNATHVDGSTEYNLHSLFGHSEGMQTHRILTNETYNPKMASSLKDKRTFLLSRSTFAGSGKYVQHWLGDNHRNWDNMKWSIAGVMNFNMFGIPMVGPDTCGFFEDQNLLGPE